MIKIPIDHIYAKIKEKTGMTDADISEKIQQKLDQLSGLISREGAAHIIANELGIKLFESPNGKQRIKDIMPGMRSITVVGKVIKVFHVTEFTRGETKSKVGSLTVGDETGVCRVTLWGSQADQLQNMHENDIIKLENAYVKENQGKSEIHLGDRATITINPDGETVDNVKSYAAATREYIKDLQPDMDNVELLGTIVQSDDIRFFEICPQCGKRVTGTEEYKCAQHGVVTPIYSYLLNTTLDDSTENIRTVFYKRQLERLLQKTEQQILQLKDTPGSFSKQELLGSIIKVVGRAKMNNMFARMEFITQLVFPNPDPNEEIPRLQKEIDELKQK